MRDTPRTPAEINSSWLPVIEACGRIQVQHYNRLRSITDILSSPARTVSRADRLSFEVAALLLYAQAEQLKDLPFGIDGSRVFPVYDPMRTCRQMLEACIAADWQWKDPVVTAIVRVLEVFEAHPDEMQLRSYLDWRLGASGRILAASRSSETTYRRIRGPLEKKDDADKA